MKITAKQFRVPGKAGFSTEGTEKDAENTENEPQVPRFADSARDDSLFPLPDVGDETEWGVEAVLGIAGEFAAETILLVEQPQNIKGNEEQEGGPDDKRAERDGNREPQQQSRRVHGMANGVIGPGGDHGLIRFDLNRARCKAIDREHPDDQEIRSQNHGLRQDLEPERDGTEEAARPAKAVVEAGEKNRQKRDQLHQPDGQRLFAPFFLGLHPALKELPIVLIVIDERGHGGRKRYRQQDPTLPESPRAGREEKQRDNQRKAERKTKENSCAEGHGGPPLRANLSGGEGRVCDGRQV